MTAMISSQTSLNPPHRPGFSDQSNNASTSSSITPRDTPSVAESSEVAATHSSSNPRKSFVVDTGVHGTSSNTFQLGARATPPPVSDVKGKGVERRTCSGGPGFSRASIPANSIGSRMPNTPLTSPPLSQHFSLGGTPIPRPFPFPAQTRTSPTISSKGGGAPLAVPQDPSSQPDCIIHLNGTQYYKWANVYTREDLSQPGSAEKFVDQARKVHKTLKQRRFSSILPAIWPSDRIVLQDINKDTPYWFCIDLDRSLYIQPGTFELNGRCTGLLVEQFTGKFWAHLEAFPMIYTLPRDVEVDFLSALVPMADERIFGWNDTPFPFSDAQVVRLIQVYRDLKRQLDIGDPRACPPLIWHIARTMVKVDAYRVQAKFGEPSYQPHHFIVSGKVSWVIKMVERCLMVLLFGVHRAYRLRLQGSGAREVIYLDDFRELLKSLIAEWSDYNLLAMIFIVANIAFMAAPGVNNLQRIASLASMICSLASLVIGMHHAWRHRTKVNASYQDAQHYTSRIRSIRDSHDSHISLTAVVLSLPLVTLLYAILSFSVALGAYCIQNSGVHGNLLLVVLLGIGGLAGIVTLIFFWHVWRGHRFHKDIDIEAYGWRTIFQGKARRGRERVGRAVQGAGNRLSRVGAVIVDGRHAPQDVPIPNIHASKTRRRARVK